MSMNRRFIWFGELFLWIVALIAISVIVVFVQSVQVQKSNSYYMFFTDIDGLTKGSPVRLMGMQIGYVQQIRVFDDKVFVSFLVTDKNAKMPEPATAAVEFYGLGGSKSLEIEPIKPNGQVKEDFIITREPYRIQMFFDATNEINRNLISISNSFTSIVDEKNLYQTKALLLMSSKIRELNCALKDINKSTEKCINDKNGKREINNASAKIREN